MFIKGDLSTIIFWECRDVFLENLRHEQFVDSEDVKQSR